MWNGLRSQCQNYNKVSNQRKYKNKKSNNSQKSWFEGFFFLALFSTWYVLEKFKSEPPLLAIGTEYMTGAQHGALFYLSFSLAYLNLGNWGWKRRPSQPIQNMNHIWAWVIFWGANWREVREEKPPSTFYTYSSLMKMWLKKKKKKKNCMCECTAKWLVCSWKLIQLFEFEPIFKCLLLGISAS